MTAQTDAATLLDERAESYMSDARKFRDSIQLGPYIPDAAQYATIYRTVADELRKVRDELRRAGAGLVVCKCCVDNECECGGEQLTPATVRGPGS